MMFKITKNSSLPLKTVQLHDWMLSFHKNERNVACWWTSCFNIDTTGLKIVNWNYFATEPTIFTFNWVEDQ